MASGDFRWFAQGLHDLGNKIHDLDTDDWRMGIIKSAANGGFDPAVNTPAPYWLTGSGTTALGASQVATGGTSYTAPIVLTSEAWALSATGAAMDCADITLAQDASGFTNGRWGIVYNNSNANKQAIGYVDLGSDRSLVSGSLTIQMNASGILSLSQA
jgi:hypothetical protein